MIGLWGANPYWQEVLRQEGTSYAVNAAEQLDRIRVLILDAAPGKRDAHLVARYAESGGSLLACAGHAGEVWPELNPRRTRIRYIAPDGSAIFRNVGLADVESTGWLCSRANAGRTDRGETALFVGKVGNCSCVLLPFDLPAVLSPFAARPRQFVADSPILPTETVSSVSRGEVRRLVANCLRFLLARQGLPYVHLSYVPGDGPSIFGYRVDTDSGPRSALEGAAGLAGRIGMKFSWYVNVGAHGGHLNLLKELARAGHDVQLHCHRHAVYRDYERNRTNLARGRAEMEQAGFHVTGTVAPYGEWNAGLERAMAGLGLSYSSEFGFASDDLPSRPLIDGVPSRVLQVPVHPVSIGRLLAARARVEQIERYYLDYIDRQAARTEPCFLYDHPERIAQSTEVLGRVLNHGVKRCGGWTTLTAFADWWRRRETLRFGIRADETALEVATETPGYADALVVELGARAARIRLDNCKARYDALDWGLLPEPVGFDRRWLRARRTGLMIRVREWLRRARKDLQAGRA